MIYSVVFYLITILGAGSSWALEPEILSVAVHRRHWQNNERISPVISPPRDYDVVATRSIDLQDSGHRASVNTAKEAVMLSASFVSRITQKLPAIFP